MTVGEALIQEPKRHLLDESWPRIEKCVAALSETELWHRDNANTNKYYDGQKLDARNLP